MNVIALSERLSSDSDSVYRILEEIGFTNIRYDPHKRQFRFARREGGNPTSVILNQDTLQFFCFRTNSKGNLYTLVMEKMGIGFAECLNYVCKKAGIKCNDVNQKIKLPFGGFYKNLYKETESPECTLKTYPESILSSYCSSPNLMFLRDGISIATQQDYNIGYDIFTNRITVPIRTLKGEICGIMGRLNDTDCPHEDRWLPVIPCSRSQTLFGFHKNYRAIQEKGICILAESEKSPMQAQTFGCNLVLGTSGCHISNTQAKYVRSLLTDRIIVAFDEGLEEEYIRNEAKKLISDNCIVKNKVGYIWDDNNDVFEKNKKQSVTDLGRDKFTYAINKKVRWL